MGGTMNLFLYILGSFFTLVIFILLINIFSIKNEQDKILSLILHGLKTNPEENELVKLCEYIWKIEKETKKIEKDHSIKLSNGLESTIRRIKELLKSQGVTYLDYVGQNPTGKGSIIKVNNFLQSKDIKLPIISDTIKPHIFISGRSIGKSLVTVTEPKPKENFEIQLDLDGGGGIPLKILFEEDTPINANELGNPTNENNHFLGWKNLQTGEDIKYPFEIKANLKLIAKWQPIVLAINLPIKEGEIEESKKVVEEPSNSEKVIEKNKEE